MPPPISETPQQRTARDKRREEHIRAARLHALNNPSVGLAPAAVSVAEFQMIVGVSRVSVYRSIADGTIESFKLRGKRLIPFSEVARLSGRG